MLITFLIPRPSAPDAICYASSLFWRESSKFQIHFPRFHACCEEMDHPLGLTHGKAAGESDGKEPASMASSRRDELNSTVQSVDVEIGKNNEVGR